MKTKITLIPHKREYRCPVVIWNKDGKALFYDRNTKQRNISKIEDIWLKSIRYDAYNYICNHYLT